MRELVRRFWQLKDELRRYKEEIEYLVAMLNESKNAYKKLEKSFKESS